jgi:hypothetical protein
MATFFPFMAYIFFFFARLTVLPAEIIDHRNWRLLFLGLCVQEQLSGSLGVVPTRCVTNTRLILYENTPDLVYHNTAFSFIKHV